MKPPARFTVLFVISLILPNAPILKAQPLFDLTHRSARFPGSGLDQPYQLNDKLIIEDSEIVSIGDSLLQRSKDYRIDYLKGIIRFKGVVSVRDTVTMTYRVFPFDLRLSYFNPITTIRPEEVAEIDTITPPPALPGATVFETGTLQKSGTLVRGITIGSDRDLSVESGLNLQVEGRLGRNVDVLALLNDQNTPIQPEGNTATLEEIDKVLIQVKTPHADATLGDYELAFTGSRYASYARKLQGARLDGRWGEYRATISGAVSKGQYYSNFFYGQDGNQGPYRLTDPEGRTGILVLAGTEKVWLDGERLQRGENNDYTIEYGLGEITFTPRRLITSDSRITVDFQYSGEVYGRDIYAAQGEALFRDGKAGLRATVMSEADAKSNPLSFVLTDSARTALESAGDDPTKAEITQVEEVDVGEGEYIADTTSWGGTTYAVFTYVGPDSIGNLNVIFSYVGAGQGDYVRVADENGFHYQWAGPGQGDYDPVQRLPLPQRHRLADLEIWTNPSQTTSLKIETALSDLDLNTFSDLDDGDNLGVAWAAEGRWRSSSGNLPPLEFDANVRSADSRFRQIDRTQQVEYQRYWDLDKGASQEERVGEARLTVRPFQLWTSQISYGAIDKEADGFASERWGAKTRLDAPGLPQINADADWVRSRSDPAGRNGMWTRGKASIRYSIKRFTPHFYYEREHKKDAYSDSTTGFLFDDYIAGLNYEAGPLTLETSQGLREEKRYAQKDLTAYSEAHTSQVKLGLTSWRNLSADAFYTHRTTTFAAADSADIRTDLMEINLGWTPFSRAVDLLANYRINNTQVSTLVQTPVYVGPGQGTHVKVGDLYFEDPDGDYILIAQSTGEFQPVTELEGSLSLDLDPHQLPKNQRDNLPEPWRYLSSQTLINFSEKTKERDVWALYRLDFSKFQGDSTLQGNLLVRQDLFLYRHRRDLSFRLRGEISQSVTNLYLSGGQKNKRRLISLRARRALATKWSVQAEIGREEDRRNYRVSGVSSRDIQTWAASLEPIYRPTREWELAARLVGSREVDGVENILAWRYGIEPRIIRSFMQKGRAELRASWYHVATDAATLPYEMADGDPPGDNFRWDLRFDYRISRYLTATLSYSGNKEADRTAVHIGQAEVRAFF